MHVKEYLEKIKGLSAKKKTQYLAIVLIIAVILLIYFSTLVPSENGENEAEPPGQSSAAFEYANADVCFDGTYALELAAPRLFGREPCFCWAV